MLTLSFILIGAQSGRTKDRIKKERGKIEHKIKKISKLSFVISVFTNLEEMPPV